MAEKSIEDLTFEEALIELEEIVTQLESGDLTLEASLALFERGQKLANRCYEPLVAEKLLFACPKDKYRRTV